MNCESWMLCSLSHVVKCPYCKETPCRLNQDQEEWLTHEPEHYPMGEEE